MFEEYFGYFQAMCLFLANMKVLQLLRFNQRLALILDTISASMNEIIGFAAIFAITYTAFCMAFMMLLSNKLYEFSNFLLVNEQAFASMLGKFSFDDILKSSTLG